MAIERKAVCGAFQKNISPITLALIGAQADSAP
jgi:hypothetical protein